MLRGRGAFARIRSVKAFAGQKMAPPKQPAVNN
jgi:hypothetical protein